jgi:hypothetical protein
VGLALQETPKGEGHNGAQGPGVTGITPLVIGTSLSRAVAGCSRPGIVTVVLAGFKAEPFGWLRQP